MENQNVRNFIQHHYRHFNAASLKDAAEGYEKHLEKGGKMFITLAGAMSTAELGLSLAEMIRADKVHAISCTGANLEEDLFNLVAHDFYKRVPNYRDLNAAEELKLLNEGFNRVTDTCIPEHEAMRRVEGAVLGEWISADKSGNRFFPHEYLFRVLKSGALEKHFQIDKKNSWLYTAFENNIPIFVPGWEDSTLANHFASHCFTEKVRNPNIIKNGIETMLSLAKWYLETSKNSSIGFFQIGGGIAGDFPICVVPMIRQDLKLKANLWGYFCQISDSTTSYGSYSGAVPNEKITWGKLDENTPKFIIESDATIVAPLIFAYLLNW